MGNALDYSKWREGCKMDNKACRLLKSRPDEGIINGPAESSDLQNCSANSQLSSRGATLFSSACSINSAVGCKPLAGS